MSNVSWNEIRDRAIKFSRTWSGVTSEQAEKQTFWNEFFELFGLRRRVVASFEEPVRNIKGQYGYIDLFWRGMLLVEHKSSGKNLDKASSQAFDYIQALAREGRHNDIPRYVIVSDFARFALHDLEPEGQGELPLFNQWRVHTTEFTLSELHKYVREFAFLKGEKAVRIDPEDPANEDAYRIMANLHDTLETGGFVGHELERFLVRILFCLFAEDTGIFEPCAFQQYLEQHTREDGSDLGSHLNRLFDTLNTAEDRRQRALDEDLAAFPYVNGALFAERLGFADFNRDMRGALLSCCRFQWARISPAVFGSLFQGIMDDEERRQQGAHYTSERDIMKVVRSLFLDELRAEYENLKGDRSTRRNARLEEFHTKLQRLTLLDPACGCGNFLVLTYRELRRLELDVLKLLHLKPGEEQQVLNVRDLCRVDVDQFYGIELNEWPVRIAEMAMWLMDHQMNLEVAEAFGQSFRRLPLRSTPHIVEGNALRLDWNTVLPHEHCNYILGNPPFIGAKYQSDTQRADMDLVAGAIRNSGLLDYVTGWYFKAAEYIQGTSVIVGFVSTNSISQGEQVGILWNELFGRYRVTIHFAHRTFTWASEARGRAHVHVVIVGFGTMQPTRRLIYDYDGEQAVVTQVRNISPYLAEGQDRAIVNRSRPLCNIPIMGIGNKPIDNGNYLFTPEEKTEFLQLEPAAHPYFRRWIGSEEFINGGERWCLWLGDCPPEQLRSMPHAMERVEAVRAFRLNSTSASTRELAERPTRFHVENMPTTPYLIVPEVSSERRRFIPIGFISPEVLSSNLVKIVPSATLFHFGILSSTMHMVWVRQVCGRLESRYRYSNKLVYNNFPWPTEIEARRQQAVETAAQAVLDARATHLPPRGSATLADLYDPLSMPDTLITAHTNLDRAVDRCYRPDAFHNDRERVEFLFALYERLAAPVLPATPRRRGRNPGQTSTSN